MPHILLLRWTLVAYPKCWLHTLPILWFVNARPHAYYISEAEQQVKAEPPTCLGTLKCLDSTSYPNTPFANFSLAKPARYASHRHGSRPIRLSCEEPNPATDSDVIHNRGGGPRAIIGPQGASQVQTGLWRLQATSKKGANATRLPDGANHS